MVLLIENNTPTHAIMKNMVNTFISLLHHMVNFLVNHKCQIREDNDARESSKGNFKEYKAGKASCILKKENILLVKFNATTKIEKHKQTVLGYALPGGERVFTTVGRRKN